MSKLEELITSWIVALWLIFFGALMCHLAWNGWAWEFNLPQFGYWHWVVTILAIRTVSGCFKKRKE